jgi:hypothetical protein
MYVANQHRQTRSKPKDDSPMSAGVGGKVPRVGVNKADLESQGIQHNWIARPLTYNEVMAMPSSELRWHDQFNAENLNKVFTVEDKKRANKQNMAKWDAKRMWEGRATEEESQKAFAAGDRFASNYAQFIRSESNGLAITLYMQEHNLDATQVQSYVTAFQALVPQGKLVLSPKAAGIGTEETLAGDELKGYARLNLLLQPNKALKPQDKLSADEWFNQHPELHEIRTPPLIQKRLAQDAHTAAHFQQAAANTVTSGSTTVTDYPDEPSGYLTHSKYKFKQYVAGLSAAQFQQKFNDPSFVAALDHTSDGNK